MACTAPPADGLSQPSDAELEQVDAREPEPVALAPRELDRSDPLLARARSGVRSGRVSAALRRELVESSNPDHRHAARLLQAIAGEPPAAVLARTEVPAAIVEVAAVEQLFEAEPEAEPAERPVEAAVELHESSDRPPRLASLPVGTPAWQWFASSLVPVERAPAPAPAVSVEPHIELASIVGPLPLLLRARPPTPATTRVKDDGPRLVILTSLSLQQASAQQTALELAGAGAAQLRVQPLTSSSLRLFVHDAGAVPGLLAARPSAPGVAVVDVARHDRTLEIEVELAPGWALQSITTLENGARVHFASS